MAEGERPKYVSCEVYKLDIQATKFGYCVCGEAKQRHSQAALENQKSNKLSPEKFSREEKGKGEACEHFTLDLTKGFGQCRCGKAKAEHTIEAQMAGGKGTASVRASRFHQLDSRPGIDQTTRKTQSTRLFVPPPKPVRSVSAREAFLRGDLGKHSSSEPSFWTSGSSTTLLQGESKKPAVEHKPRRKIGTPDVDLTYFRFLGGELADAKESELGTGEAAQFRNPILMNELAAKLGVDLSPRNETSQEFLVPDEEQTADESENMMKHEDEIEVSVDCSVTKKEGDVVLTEKPGEDPIVSDETTISDSSNNNEQVQAKEEDHSVKDQPIPPQSIQPVEEAEEAVEIVQTTVAEIEGSETGSAENDVLLDVAESQGRKSVPSNDETCSEVSEQPDSDSEDSNNTGKDQSSQYSASDQEEKDTDMDNAGKDELDEIQDCLTEKNNSETLNSASKIVDTGMQSPTPQDYEREDKAKEQITDKEEEPKWATDLEPTRINDTDQNYDKEKRKKVCCLIM